MKRKCSDCCHPEAIDPRACGCCEGIGVLTPLSTANRPGLRALSYRIGTHASFLETMKARLSGGEFPELANLTTREGDDFSIALLDAWATVADVLTFYQERIANEGYLRTATERRSVLELARLVGYRLRPGVAASVFLAYSIDENTREEVIIPAGSQARSVPGPDEKPQTFETSEDLKARARWNNLKPRMTRPQTYQSITSKLSLYLKGVSTNLKPNDPLLIQKDETTKEFYRIKAVHPDRDMDRTLVVLQNAPNSEAQTSLFQPVKLIEVLTARPSLQPANRFRLTLKLNEQFKDRTEAGFRTVKRFAPLLRETLSDAMANARVTPEVGLKVYAMRLEAPLFGHNAPQRTRIEEDGSISIIGDWPVIEVKPRVNGDSQRIEHEEENALHLDARYDGLTSDDWIVIETQDTPLTDSNVLITKPEKVVAGITRSEYGMTAPTTRIELREKWINITDHAHNDNEFNAIRTTRVYAQPQALELAEEPIKTPVCGDGCGDRIELDGLYEDLEPGRWVIVSGEREIEGTGGVRYSELAMIAGVVQDVARDEEVAGSARAAAAVDGGAAPRAGEKIHTHIRLANKLAYCFRRDTVTIHGNVVKATHGETREEILGSGDGSKALQKFELKQKPLTFVPASNPKGVDSTLRVFVNEVQWHEAETLADRQPKDRSFVTRTDDDDTTAILFGNGQQGARLPTGTQNVRAVYRAGIGKPGNVGAGQISLLLSKPLGVKEVVNPLRASGGADREGRDQARKHAPLAVMALDRLVSVRDYEDFARTYAGIGKARAVELSDGRRRLIHVTIAGADDIPIDETSDLFLNLRQALHDFGDPHLPVQLAVRELLLIVLSAGVRILPDYQWEDVATRLRTALLEAFGFERRELGQDVVLSEVIAVMQAVRGVAYVDVDAFGGIPEKIAEDGERRLLTPDEVAEAVECTTTRWSHADMAAWCSSYYRAAAPDDECTRYEKCRKYGNVGQTTAVRQRLQVNLARRENGTIYPAQLAFLSPEVPETLILNRIK